MLGQHHGDRAHLLRQPGIDQRGEQHALFLLVVTSVCEALHEISRIDKETGTNRLAVLESHGRRLKGGQHAFDDPVLLHQDISRFHVFLPWAFCLMLLDEQAEHKDFCLKYIREIHSPKEI